MAEPELTEVALRKAAGSTSYDRGEDYVRYVHGLRIEGTRASASIQGRRVYLVELDWSSSRVLGNCTCPHNLQGNFCKHLVALGLTVVDEEGPLRQAPVDSEQGVVAAYVERLDQAELRALVAELVDSYPEIERTLKVRAATVTADPGVAAAELTRLAQEALRTRGFIDYRRSFDVARDAKDLLDELENHVDAGAADAVRPALLKAVTRLRTITLNADDSSGSIGSACQRALDLYARTCRVGKPDGVKVAKWLVKFRDDSPGWPDAELSDFVDAFDERAMAAYRAAVARVDAAHPNVEGHDRFEVERMLLELADHDGEVDRAVVLLTRRPGHEDYPGVVDRLRAVGRADARPCASRGFSGGGAHSGIRCPGREGPQAVRKRSCANSHRDRRSGSRGRMVSSAGTRRRGRMAGTRGGPRIRLPGSCGGALSAASR